MIAHDTMRSWSRAASYVFLIVTSVVMVLPFFWMISTAFKGPQEAYIYPPTLFPAGLHWENFSHVLETVPFIRFYLNSILVTSIITAGQVVTASLAGYVFARIEFFGRDLIFYLYLATTIIPTQVTMLPLFLIMSKLGWLDTYQALTVPFLSSSFAVFFLRQFFATAARIDGASHVRTLFQIVLPSLRPAIATITLFTFLTYWDSYLWPLIVTNTTAMRVLPIGLRFFIEESGAQLNYMMAGALMAVAPIIVIFFFAQKQFIEGIALTGLKG
jgi:multiple sugar transport system permease protein